MNLNHYYYSLGYFFADGSIYTPTYRLSIEGVAEDLLPMVHIFNSIVNWKLYERNRTRNDNQCKPALTLYKGSKKLTTQLIDQGYYQPFCGIKPLSFVPDEYKYLWYRGFFDGDGCVYYNKQQYLKQVSISGKYDMDWQFITNTFPFFTCRKVTGKNSYSQCRIASLPNIKSFHGFLYPNGYDDIGLKRKFDMLEAICH
jgi:hypothetical protein